MLSKLDKLAPTDSEFDKLVAEFIPAARRHINFEESQVWPQLRVVLTPEQAAELGAQVTRAKENGPTRPHPHTPARQTVLKTA